MATIAHTEQNPRVEDNIRRIRMQLSFGLARHIMHDALVPQFMTEEEFFLAYMAAVVLNTDEVIGYVPE